MSTLTKCFIISFYCLFSFFNQTSTAQTENQGLFDNDSPLKMALPPFFEDPAKTPRKYAQVLSYQDANGQTIKIPIEVKARGHFRGLLGNCTYPPLHQQSKKMAKGVLISL